MAYSVHVHPVLSPGAVCGGCQVVRLLGSGGFAQVYEARGPDGSPRALKILDANQEEKPKMRARLAQEGAALALLNHANVVRLYDAGVDDDRIYLVLELVDGKNLWDVKRAGPPPLATLVRWIHQAAEGVAEAHRRGIVHRDLKPENLLVTSQGVVKVIDFGVAKLHGWGVKTTNEQQLGTALYMSPEQIKNAPPDPRMDVYALGLILYEAVAGVHPVVPKPSNVYQICRAQLTERPRPLLEAVPSVPPELGAVVDRAIEKDPARRLPDMRAFADGLHGALLRIEGARIDALRDLTASPGPTKKKPLPATQPMQAVDPATTGPATPFPSMPSGPQGGGPPAHLVRTAPLGGPLPFAVTAAVRSSDVDPPAPPRVLTALPSHIDPTPLPAIGPSGPALVPPPPPRARRGNAALIVVGTVVILLAAAGAALWATGVIHAPF